ncbi:ATP synthase subunit I [Lederbergia sp. NSJ-179]|uniref:ATP synthase subunit I n=1 Tax=Lederbergia sp. NSJ-179 TaxID=2931402 RepID=UPI001FD31363|nr:ATP synthase subunit I [Lederbergia sp. NSJ-179]MCJ7840571.1 ATP synthase subunit I [Lederbergia sp. NSJ-179]
MPELQQVFIRHCKYIIYLLAIYVLGWGFTEYKAIFMGLILGTSVSLFNHWNLYRKTNRIEQAMSEDKKVYGIGTLTRMAAVILVVFIALEFEHVFHMTSVIIGIVTAYAVIMIDFIVQKFKPRK